MSTDKVEQPVTASASLLGDIRAIRLGIRDAVHVSAEPAETGNHREEDPADDAHLADPCPYANDEGHQGWPRHHRQRRRIDVQHPLHAAAGQNDPIDDRQPQRAPASASIAVQAKSSRSRRSTPPGTAKSAEGGRSTVSMLISAEAARTNYTN